MPISAPSTPSRAVEPRRRRRGAALVAGLLAASLACFGSGASAAFDGPGDHTHALKVGARERTYHVHEPQGHASEGKRPVVLAFHGGGGRAELQARVSGLSSKADREGFLVVYPEGTGRSGWGERYTWNAGRCCGYAKKENVDDIAFVKAMLDDLAKRYAVDPKRIYATGMSNGAAFTYRVACELADRIAAVAPVAGHDAFDGCKPARPVPVMHFHGTADENVSFQGGTCGGRAPGDPGWKCRSVPAYSEAWAEMDGCSEAAKTVFEKNGSSCVSHASCRGGAEVVLCTVKGGGHTWPGGQYSVDKRWFKRLVGPINPDVPATDLMWDFFQRHPMP